MPPDRLLLEMAAAGVDGGALTPQGVYGDDNGLELLTAENYPRKFVVVGWVDHTAEDLEQTVAREIERGLKGVRLLGMNGDTLPGGAYDRILQICQQNQLAVALWLPHPVPEILERVFEEYSGINFLIDHLGVGYAPPAHGLPPEDPWELLPDVLSVSKHGNVNVKLTGAPALSRETYPFKDVWDGIERLVESFGSERIVWGSDITRTGSLNTYAEATHYLREISGFASGELTQMYGGNLRRLLRWDPNEYIAGLGISTPRDAGE